MTIHTKLNNTHKIQLNLQLVIKIFYINMEQRAIIMHKIINFMDFPHSFKHRHIRINVNTMNKFHKCDEFRWRIISSEPCRRVIQSTGPVYFILRVFKHRNWWQKYSGQKCNRYSNHPVLNFWLHANLTLRRLMSYIYGAPILDVSRSHTTTQHSR